MGLPSVFGNKPHQRFAFCLDILNNILDGYNNQAIMASTLKDLISVLPDPELPFTEMSSILSTLSGRMPAKLEEGVRAALDGAQSKNGSLDFPAVRIRKLLDQFISSEVRAPERPMLRAQLGALYDVTESYRSGLKQHEIDTLAGLLERYEETEKVFGGSIEARVLKLRVQFKDDIDKVAALVPSHLKVQSKAKLVFAILDEVKSSGTNISNAESRLHKACRAWLHSKRSMFSILFLLPGSYAFCPRSSTAVSLKAREVLITGQMPSFEERAVQMETILRQSVTTSYYGEASLDHRNPHPEVLKELTDSRHSVYDVLPKFSNHEDPWVALSELHVFLNFVFSWLLT